MKKEVFLAVLVGFGLGLIITFGIWTANKNLKATPPVTADNVSPTPQPEASDVKAPASETNSDIPLVITSPEQDELLVNSSSLTISGKTTPGNSVAIIYESNQELQTADAAGLFSLEINLEGGYNRLTITSFNTKGESVSKDILVTYSTQKI
jgi:hypothetical protein